MGFWIDYGLIRYCDKSYRRPKSIPKSYRHVQTNLQIRIEFFGLSRPSNLCRTYYIPRSCQSFDRYGISCHASHKRRDDGAILQLWPSKQIRRENWQISPMGYYNSVSFYWHIIALQCCVSSCRTTKWISCVCVCACITSLLDLHPIPHIPPL